MSFRLPDENNSDQKVELTAMLNKVIENIKNDAVDIAINSTIAFIKSKGGNDIEIMTTLQEHFFAAAIKIADSNFDESSNYCEKLALWQPEQDPALFAGADTVTPSRRQSDSLESASPVVNFNSVDIKTVLSMQFKDITTKEKLMLRRIMPLIGAVYSEKVGYVSSCLKLGVDLVLLPLTCAQNSENMTVIFLEENSLLRQIRRSGSIVELYPQFDIAVLKLEQSDAAAVKVSFATDIVEQSQLFLLNYSKNGDYLQVSSSVFQSIVGSSSDSLTTAKAWQAGGVYVNSDGEIVSLQTKPSNTLAVRSGLEQYGYIISKILANVDTDSVLGNHLQPQRLSNQESTILTASNTCILATIDVKSFTKSLLLAHIRQSIDDFYKSGSHEFGKVQVDDIIHGVGDNAITISFTIVIKRHDKCLAGIEVNARTTDGSGPPTMMFGNQLNGYNQVLRAEYPCDEKKIRRTNNSGFEFASLAALVIKLSYQINDKTLEQEIFDYFLHFLRQ